MQITLTIEAEVDPVTWATEYGTTLEEVPGDVGKYLASGDVDLGPNVRVTRVNVESVTP